MTFYLSIYQYILEFLLLVVMNNSAMNICVQVILWTYVYSSLECIYLGMGLLDHMGTLCLEELMNCFPKWLHHFTFPPAVFEGSNSSTSSSALVIFCLFGFFFLIGVKLLYNVMLLSGVQ